MTSFFSVASSSSRPAPASSYQLEEHDESDADAPQYPKARSSFSHPRPRAPFPSSASSNAFIDHSHTLNNNDYLFPPSSAHPPSARSSVCSTPLNSPAVSRSTSPLPQFFSSGISSASTTDSDSEQGSPLLGIGTRTRWFREDRRRWWGFRPNFNRRRGHSCGVRALKRIIKRLLRHPFFPRQPITIVRTS